MVSHPILPQPCLQKELDLVAACEHKPGFCATAASTARSVSAAVHSPAPTQHTSCAAPTGASAMQIKLAQSKAGKHTCAGAAGCRPQCWPAAHTRTRPAADHRRCCRCSRCRRRCRHSSQPRLPQGRTAEGISLGAVECTTGCSHPSWAALQVADAATGAAGAAAIGARCHTQTRIYRVSWAAEGRLPLRRWWCP